MNQLQTNNHPFKFDFLNLLLRFLRTCVLLTPFLTGADAAADTREVVVRPNLETVKRWLYNHEIIVARRKLWFDRIDRIEPSKIANITAEGGSVFQKLLPGTNFASSVWRFEYPDGNGKTNSYAVFIEYEWSVGVTGIDRKFVKAIVSGP